MKVNNITEVVIRLVDGRFLYGYLLNKGKNGSYKFVSTSRYKDYVQSNNKSLIERLPSFLVSSIVTHELH